METLANLGAYMSLFSSATPTYLYATLLSGQYDIPAIHANVKTVYTNTVPVDAYRGAGRPEATYLVERMLTTAARQLGVDPAELRRKNFIRSFPHQTPVIMAYDAGDFDACLDAALQAADYEGFEARKAEAKSRGKLRGIGLSSYIEACGIAPSAAVGSLGAGVGLWESAEVRVNPVGTIEVLTGSHSHGQGHETTFTQVVCDRFGVAGRQRADRPRRHRQGAVRHGHLRLALGRRRHVGHRQGARQGRGQGEADRRAPARGVGRRYRDQGRRGLRRRHRQEARLARGLPCSLYRPQPARRAWSRA